MNTPVRQMMSHWFKGHGATIFYLIDHFHLGDVCQDWNRFSRAIDRHLYWHQLNGLIQEAKDIFLLALIGQVAQNEP